MMEFKIDVSALTGVDRLGVAACRLTCYEWDEILGPKPNGFDELPNTRKYSIFGRKKICREDYVFPAYSAIKSVIGYANISRCWWKYVLGRSDEEWLRWYVAGYIKGYQKTK